MSSSDHDTSALVKPSKEGAPQGQSKAAPKPPPGYKFVKVRRPDGTIATVKRKLSPEEAAAQGVAVPSETADKPAAQPAGQPAGAPNYKIVTVRQADGTFVRVKRKVDPSEPAKSEDGPATDKPAKEAEKPTAVSSEKTVSETPAKTEPVVKSKEIQDQAQPSVATPREPEPSTSAAAVDTDFAADDALHQQMQDRRARKMHRFKSALVTGLVTAIGGGAISHTVHIGDFKDGDEILSDSDWSDDEDFDNDGHHDDHHHDDDDMDHHHHDDDNDLHHDDDPPEYHGHEDATHGHEGTTGSGGGLTLDLGAAAGGLAAAAAASARAPPPARSQPDATAREVPAAGADEKGAASKTKVTYKVDPKELEEREKRAAEATSRPLHKHWANVSFYFLASLSIVLPLLFLVLGIFIFIMNKKEADTGSWHVLQDVIKVAISAWPIVFAAVVAQVFKTWATYKVERGIKLMELEQLVGSNSFASAVKQPFLLRRLDLLSVILFLTWCLSPVGSQALQRSYRIDYQVVNETTTVYYLNMTGSNRALSMEYLTVRALPPAGMLNIPATQRQVAILYNKQFSPTGIRESPFEDDYNNPFATWVDEGEPSGIIPSTPSRYGVPILRNSSVFDSDNSTTAPTSGSDSRFEATTFPVSSSYFNFTCGPWSIVPGSYFENETMFANSTPFVMSNSTTMRVRMLSKLGVIDPYSNTTVVDTLEFASAIQNGSTRYDPSALWVSGNTSLHSLIECSFKQIYVDYGVTCYRRPSITEDYTDGSADCYYDSDFLPIRPTPADKIVGRGAQLADLSQGLAVYGNPPEIESMTNTPNELYLGLYPDNLLARDPNYFNLSALAQPDVFAYRMAHLFNTYVDVANSFDYLGTNFTVANLETYRSELVPAQGWHAYTKSRVYLVDWAWTAVFMACVALLLAAGCFSVAIESLTVAPDVLGYVSSVARNSKYLQLPKEKLNSGMTGGERAKVIGSTKVMMQDVKANAPVGRIALGLKHDQAQKLTPGRLYR